MMGGVPASPILCVLRVGPLDDSLHAKLGNKTVHVLQN